MPDRPRQRALGYIRVSSYLGRDREDSLTEPLQLEKIQQWCAVADLDLVDVLRDVDRSGKDFDGKRRPAFDELMARLDAGEGEAVVVYRMSRFGRDFYETIRTVRRLRDQGIQFHSASERIDLESPNGRLMFNVPASFDEYELDIRREYWAETKARVIKERGVHLGRTPLGYLRASKQPKLACDITLERAAELLRALGSDREPVSGGLIPDPAVAPAITRAFDLRAAGAQYPAIIAMLDRDAPRPGGRLWTHTQVARMFSLRVYLGEVGQRDLVVPDAHEPLVDEATFAAAQVAACAAATAVPARTARGHRRQHRSVRRGGIRSLRAPPHGGIADAGDRRRSRRDRRGARARRRAHPPPVLGASRRARRRAVAGRDERTGPPPRGNARAASPIERRGHGHGDAMDRSGARGTVRGHPRGMGAVVVRKARRRGEPIHERARIYAAGTVEHLLPSKANGMRLMAFDFGAADRAVNATLERAA